jgi:signal transduction histidine kinase/ActR/RegA family two-component response regulator
MAQRCVSILLDRVREVTRIEQQSEKLNALGKLAANLAHELNNPASAAQRSAASLFGELREYGEQKYRLGNLCLNEEEIASYRAWVQNARARISAYSGRSQGPQSPLATTDREEALIRWLEAHHIPQPWTIAPALSETNLALDLLDELAAITRPEVLPVAVATVASSLRVERMAETVVDSTVRIFDLISAIKDYSYMDQAPIQDVDLAQSLENTLVMFNSRLKNVVVELEFDPELPPISAYGSELNQVWTSLIENALESMNDMGTLRLTTHLNGQMALVEVWDSGPGIDPSIRSRIFEPFFTTKEKGKGTGLGLATVYGVVKQSGGFIWVYSEVGKGASFKIYLPRVEGVEDHPAPPRQLLQIPRGTETVLLAEDENDVRDVARQFLESGGYRVVEACDGEQALRVAAEHAGKIDLLVTDMIMPGMTGQELAGRLVTQHAGIRVIFMSGYSELAASQVADVTSAMRSLTKPFSRGSLLRTVREILDAAPVN